MQTEQLLKFYKQAKLRVAINHQHEIDHVNNLNFSKTTANIFAFQFFYVVINTGMKNQIAEKIMDEFIKSNWNPDVIKHEQKRVAIIQCINNYPLWFERLKSINSERGKIEYLETLPFIGKITKYHLARNIGLDCAKPDRWLMFLADKYDFPTPRFMCEWLSTQTGDRVGVVDVVLWRYCNLYPKEVKGTKQELLQ